MSALDKLFNKDKAEKPAGMLGVLSSLIPPGVAEELQANISNMVQYFKNNTDISVAQGIAILENQRRIMAHLGIDDDGNSNRDSGTGSNAGTDNRDNPGD